MRRIVTRLVADALLVLLVVSVAAGTVSWWRPWVLVAVLLVVRLTGAVAVHRVNAGLLRERAGSPVRADQPRSDRVLVLAVLGTGFLGVPALAAGDASRWHLLVPPAAWLSAMGLVLYALGWTLKSLALHANAFAVTVVRLQSERGHAVADRGVYAVVRHPFYAADPLIFIGGALWLQSTAAVFAAIVPIALMVCRLVLEERFLHDALPGYAAYAARVRYRLVPGVW